MSRLDLKTKIGVRRVVKQLVLAEKPFRAVLVGSAFALPASFLLL